MSRWRTPALVALWAQVAALAGTAAFGLWRGGLGGRTWPVPQVWLGALEAGLAAVVLAWWTALLARVLRGVATPETGGTWRALVLTFPWLTALRASLWLALLLELLAGAGAGASPVALTALMTVWAGVIVASNATFAGLAAVATGPADPAARRRLREWLNVSAALSLALGVMNVVPIEGFSAAPDLQTQLVYGGGALLDVLASVLAYHALGAGLPTPGSAASR